MASHPLGRRRRACHRRNVRGSRQPGQLILATATVVVSWAFIHSIFTLHYAHEFYGEGRDRKKRDSGGWTWNY